MSEGAPSDGDERRGDGSDTSREVDELVAEAVSEAVERQASDHRELRQALDQLLDRLRHLDDDLDRRDQELRDLIETILAKTISAESGQLRDEVTRELSRLEERIERLLGSGLMDVGVSLGDELQTLRTRAALGREERRTDLQVANRIRAMEDRLDRLIRSVSSRPAISPEEVTAELRALNEELATSLRGSNDELAASLRRTSDELAESLRGSTGELAETLRGSNDELAETVRRANEELATSLTETVTGDGSSTRETVDSLADQLGGRLDDLPSETRLVAVYERLEEVLQRLRDERDALEERLNEGLARGRQDVVDELDLRLDRHRDEVGEELARIFDQLSRSQAETESREAARRAELLDHLETLFDGGLAELRRAADRLGTEVGRLGPELSERVGEVVDDLSGDLDRISERIKSVASAVQGTETRLVDHTATGLREFEHRVVARTGERTEALVEKLAGRTGDRIDDLDDATQREVERVASAVEALRSQVGELESRAASILDREEGEDPEERRRELLADIARALEGRVCPECGFVARNERGLSVHQRTHTEDT